MLAYRMWCRIFFPFEFNFLYWSFLAALESPSSFSLSIRIWAEGGERKVASPPAQLLRRAKEEERVIFGAEKKGGGIVFIRLPLLLLPPRYPQPARDIRGRTLLTGDFIVTLPICLAFFSFGSNQQMIENFPDMFVHLLFSLLFRHTLVQFYFILYSYVHL